MIGRLRDEIAHQLGRFGPAEGMAQIVEAWPSAVGPEIARNAWPARLGRDGTLYVHTSSSAWAFELGQLEQRLRAPLGEHAPARFRFVVGPLPEHVGDQSEDHSVAPVEPTPEHVAEAESLARGIDDEELRKVVVKAAAASLAKARSDR